MLHQFPSGYKAPEVPFYAIKWAVMGAPVAHSPVWDRDVCWLEYDDIIQDEAGKELGFGVVWLNVYSVTRLLTLEALTVTKMKFLFTSSLILVQTFK